MNNISKAQDRDECKKSCSPGSCLKNFQQGLRFAVDDKQVKCQQKIKHNSCRNPEAERRLTDLIEVKEIIASDVKNLRQQITNRKTFLLVKVSDDFINDEWANQTNPYETGGLTKVEA